MLTNEQFDKWLAMLRSRQYMKHQGTLKGPHEYSFCALGVLAFPVLGLVDSFSGRTAVEKEGTHSADFIPPRFMSRAHQAKVYKKNDSLRHLTFSQIADWLEANRDAFVEPAPVTA